MTAGERTAMATTAAPASLLLPALLLLLPAASSASFAAFAPSSLAPSFARSPPRLLRASSSSSSLRAAASASRSLEAILFDCDGVLADTERDGHRPAFNIAFSENDIDEEWDEGRYGTLLEVGGGKERMTAHWNEVGWPAAIPEEGRSDKILSLHLQKTDVFMRLIDEGRIPLRPGVLRIVDEAIAAGVKLAVCSTSNEKAVSNLVSTLMGSDRASKFRVFAGDMVPRKKPAPDVYLMAVEEMGLDKDRCVIVEDSRIGVGAAVAAGIPCLVTKSSYTAGEDFSGARMIVDELGDGPGPTVTLATLAGLLGDDDDDGAPSSAPPGVGARGTGVTMEGHVDRGGASWTGARFGDDVTAPANKPSGASQSPGPPSIGVPMEGHVEAGGASWTGARFGDDVTAPANKPSGAYQSPGPPSIGVPMEGHVEAGGASWTGARFGDDVTAPANTPSGAYQSPAPPSIGVPMEGHIEAGGASWTGARLGDDNVNRARAYSPSETYEFRSKGKGVGSRWDAAAHTDVPPEGGDGKAWSGARFGDEDVKSVGPTPSQWHE